MLTPFWLFGFALSALWYNKTRFLRGSLLVVDRPRRARARPSWVQLRRSPQKGCTARDKCTHTSNHQWSCQCVGSLVSYNSLSQRSDLYMYYRVVL